MNCIDRKKSTNLKGTFDEHEHEDLELSHIDGFAPGMFNMPYSWVKETMETRMQDEMTTLQKRVCNKTNAC